MTVKLFADIRKSILSRTNRARYKREGSIIYDIASATAFELEALYHQLEFANRNMYVKTADSEALLKYGEQYQVPVLEATKAFIKAEFNTEVPETVKFKCDGVEYSITRKLEEIEGKHYYEMICSEYGTVGNLYSGRLVPEVTIATLTDANIVDVLIPARDLEDVEHYRKRVLDSFNRSDFAGNRSDYANRISAIPGVGAVKVERAPAGAGTVGVTILNSDHNKASKELIKEVQDKVDPADLTGEGYGFAPIGHRVLVDSVTEKEVNVTVTLELSSGTTYTAIKANIENTITDYLKTLRLEWKMSETTKVRASHIVVRLLEIAGIRDVLSITVNGNANSITLTAKEIPVLGLITNV